MSAIVVGFRYRFQNLNESREAYRRVTAASGPLLICSNHLTYLDPVLLHYAFGSHPWYFLNYKRFAWNLAASEYSGHLLFAPICFLSKVLFIRRAARPKYLKDLFQVVSELLVDGDVVSIFPEGRRSRTGRFDNRKLAYGIGQILDRIPGDVTVLCVYLRGVGSSGFGAFPKPGSTFFVTTRVLKVNSKDQATDACVRQIAEQIRRLENEFFQTHPRVELP